MKYKAVPLLFLLLFLVSCDKKNRLTTNTMSIAVDPATEQAVAEGARIPLKAICPADVNPAWSVENNLGTFDPPQGKETTFIAGNAAGRGKIFATYGTVRGQTTVAVGNCPPANNNGGSGGGSGGGGSGGGGTGGGTGGGGSGGGSGCGGNTFDGPTFGLFSETFVIPGILLDTNSSRFRGGGCIGVWPDGIQTILQDGTQPGEMTEGFKGIKCTVGISGGFWMQFGSDDLPGLSDADAMVANNMSAFSGGSLKFDIKTEKGKDVLIAVKWGEGEPLPNAYITLRELGVPRDGNWHSVSIPLKTFHGIDFSKIKVPVAFSSAPGCTFFTFIVDNVRWEK